MEAGQEANFERRTTIAKRKRNEMKWNEIKWETDDRSSLLETKEGGNNCTISAKRKKGDRLFSRDKSKARIRGRSLKDAIKHVYSCKCVNYYATFEMVRVNILFVLPLNRIRSSYKLSHLLQAQVSDIFVIFKFNWKGLLFVIKFFRYKIIMTTKKELQIGSYVKILISFV